MCFHARIFCIVQPTYSKALFPFVTGVHAICEVLQCSGTLIVPSRVEKWRGRWVCLPLLCECPINQGTPGVSEGHLSVLWSSVQNGFLSRVSMLSVYEFRLFISIYSQRKYTRWGESTVKSSETELHCSQKACNTGKSQNQQDVCETERDRLRESERQRLQRQRERESMFGFSEVIWVWVNLAGLHTVSGNSPLLGKTPSIFLDTSSRHKIPVKVKEMYQHHVFPQHPCVPTK